MVEMEKQSLSNFYIPFKTLCNAAISSKTFEEIEEAVKSDADSPASQFSSGIIDG